MSARQRGVARAVWLLLWVCVGCQRGSSPASSRPAPSASASASASAVTAKRAMTPEEDAAFQGNNPQEAPLLLGPSPAGIGSAEREQRVKELLSGQSPAERLPLVAVASGAGYDSSLYDSLTTELDTRPPVVVKLQVSPVTLVSGALDQALASRVIAAMHGSFRNCYRRALEQNEDAPHSIKLDVALLISPDGTVEAATIEPQNVPALSGFYRCLQTRATAPQFQPAPGKPSRLRFSVDATGSRRE